MSLTRLKAMNKLGNALRAKHGRKWSTGKWLTPPQPHAQERVDRWKWRCEHRNIKVNL